MSKIKKNSSFIILDLIIFIISYFMLLYIFFSFTIIYKNYFLLENNIML